MVLGRGAPLQQAIDVQRAAGRPALQTGIWTAYTPTELLKPHVSAAIAFDLLLESPLQNHALTASRFACSYTRLMAMTVD